MNIFIATLLFPVFVWSQTKPPPIQSLYLDLPVQERINKRIELSRKIVSDNNDTGYFREETEILYALNVKDDPTHGFSWYNWIHKILNKGNPGGNFLNNTSDSVKKADSMLSIALEKNPDDIHLKLMQAIIKTKKRIPYSEFRADVEKVKDRSTVLTFNDLLQLAMVYTHNGDTNGALSVYDLMETVASTRDEKVTVYQGRGLLGQETENWNACVDGYRKSEAAGDGGLGVQVSLAYCLRQLDRDEEAIAIGEKVGDVGEMTCQTAAARSAVGFKHYKNGMIDQAEDLGLKSQKACPSSSSEKLLAFVYVKKNQLEKAFGHVKKAESGAEDKMQFYRNWSTMFGANQKMQNDLLLESYKFISNPEQKMSYYFADSNSLLKAKDPMFLEFARKAMAEGDQLSSQNETNYHFMRDYGLLYAIYGIDRDSLINLGKARNFLTKAKSLKSDYDSVIDQTISSVNEIEKGIREGRIKPSEP